jgi:hypothetical protein
MKIDFGNGCQAEVDSGHLDGERGVDVFVGSGEVEPFFMLPEEALVLAEAIRQCAMLAMHVRSGEKK